MVGYLRSTGLQVAEPFTTNLKEAADSIRVPFQSIDEGSAPFLGLIDCAQQVGKLRAVVQRQ